jgi:serine-type D-Ala-D-Ala carboxypeptidase/endopeptidase (penicillin-binding protein 4)
VLAIAALLVACSQDLEEDQAPADVSEASDEHAAEPADAAAGGPADTTDAAAGGAHDADEAGGGGPRVVVDVEPPPPPATRNALVSALEDLVDEAVAEMGDATLTVLVVDEYGRELVAHQPDRPVLPASTTKLVTAAAALTTLGADARLVTRAEVTGPIDVGGAMSGDLLLVGGGDPVLVTDEYLRWIYPARPHTRLAQLADEVVAAGVTRIDGDVVGISDGFPGQRVPSGWPDEYFATLDARNIDGLTVDAGLRTIVTFPGALADSAEADADADDNAGNPADADPSVDDAADAAAGAGATDADAGATDDAATDAGANDAATDAGANDAATDAGANDAAGAATDAGPTAGIRAPTDLDELERELGTPRVIVDHVTDPRLHAAIELTRMLEDRGVEVVGEPRADDQTPPTVGRIASVHSPPMGELLRFAVARSDNHISDQLFRLVGRVRTGIGSWERGDRAVRQVLDRLGVDHSDAAFEDGSGLSRDDRVTARMLIELDRAMQASRHRALWLDLMAVTGERGTLENRLTGTAGVGRFYGKTGTLNDVNALVGTVVGSGPGTYHLAVVVNDAPGGERWVGRSLQDELILRLVADLDAQAPAEDDPAAEDDAAAERDAVTTTDATSTADDAEAAGASQAGLVPGS